MFGLTWWPALAQALASFRTYFWRALPTKREDTLTPKPAAPIVAVDAEELLERTSEETLPTPQASADEIAAEYRRAGHRDASLHGGTVYGFETGLHKTCAAFILESERSSELPLEQRRKLNRVKKLQEEKALYETQKKGCDEEEFAAKQKLIEHRRDIEVARSKARIVTEEENGVSQGTLRLYVATIAVTCLAVFVYYLTSFFLYPINWTLRAQAVELAGEDLGVIFTNIFNTPEAFQWGVHYLFAGFAVFFLVIGQAFLAHGSGEKNSKSAPLTWVLLSVILAVDAIIAHHIQDEQIAVKVKLGMAKMGELSPYNGEMLLSVLLGFGAALAGSLLYTRYLALTRVKNHAAQAELQVTLLQAEIQKLELAMAKIQMAVEKALNRILEINNELLSLYQELKAFTTQAALRLRLSAYHSGYAEYVQQHLSVTEAPERLVQLSTVFQRICPN